MRPSNCSYLRLLAPYVHCRNHVHPLNREREACEVEERAVLRVRHAIHMHRGCRALCGLQVDICECARLRARAMTVGMEKTQEHVSAAWQCDLVSKVSSKHS